MTYDKQKIKAKAEQYCKANNSIVSQELGFGTQGVVYLTEHNTALKVHSLESGYVRERAVYQRLQERSIRTVQGLNIPRLVAFDDILFVIEMSFVHVPCLLDFGSTYLDIVPEHVVRDDMWHEKQSEDFG